MTLRPLASALLALLFAGSPAQAAQDAPRRVVLLIGDGFGPASLTLARACAGSPLALDAVLVGSLGTRPAVGQVTDSAAAATALASGHATLNGAIGVDPEGQPVASLLEAAEAHGLATGLVTTTTITHATPAAFGAHVTSRAFTLRIAEQLLAQGIEVLLGGGSADFVPLADGGLRSDGRDLLAEAAADGTHVLSSPAELERSAAPPVLGLFASSYLAYELDRDPQREPSLEQMTRAALRLLADDPDGFFLMVEGGRIDHAAHGNDPAGLVHDALAFDRAVAVALAFAREHDDTLVLVTADHETGGLSLGRDVDGVPNYAFDPAPLMAAHASAEALALHMLAGTTPADALARDWQLDDVSDDRLDEFEGLVDRGELGPLALHLSRLLSERAGLDWTTLGHTGVDVPLCAVGPGAERFAGHLHNTELGRRLAELLGFDLDAQTARLRVAPAR